MTCISLCLHTNRKGSERASALAEPYRFTAHKSSEHDSINYHLFSQKQHICDDEGAVDKRVRVFFWVAGRALPKKLR